jgi:hypothetical protein
MGPYVAANNDKYTTTIKEFSFYKMPVKELKSEETTIIPPSNTAIYADFFTVVIVAAMLCGTLISITQMWVSERHEEFTYMRSANP